MWQERGKEVVTTNLFTAISSEKMASLINEASERTLPLLALLVVVVIGIAGCRQQAEQDAGKEIIIPRFGIHAMMPSQWEAVNRSENGDGLYILTADQNNDIRVYGSYVSSDISLYEEMISDPAYNAEKFRFDDGGTGWHLSNGKEHYWIRTVAGIDLGLHAKSSDQWLRDNMTRLTRMASSMTIKEDAEASGK